jgi:hypothetical protein
LFHFHTARWIDVAGLETVISRVIGVRLPCRQANCGVMQNITVTLKPFSYHELHDVCRLFLMKPHRVFGDQRLISLSFGAVHRTRAARRMLSLPGTVRTKRGRELVRNPQLRHRAAKGIMNRNSFFRKQFFLQFTTVLILFGPHIASAQVGPAARLAPDISIFATATDAKPNFHYLYDRAVYGFSAGGFWQTRHILGVEVRGSILKWGSNQHEESALAGPRAARRFGRITPYGCGLVGAGNAWSRNLPGKTPFIIEDVGLQWSILGGVDYRLAHHFRLRVGELGYSKIYLPDRTLTALTASAGLVYRIN